jgi:hypothetical protein
VRVNKLQIQQQQCRASTRTLVNERARKNIVEELQLASAAARARAPTKRAVRGATGRAREPRGGRHVSTCVRDGGADTSRRTNTGVGGPRNERDGGSGRPAGGVVHWYYVTRTVAGGATYRGPAAS